MEHEHEHQMGRSKRSDRIVNWLIGALVVIAAYFLITEHRAHVVPYLPWLLVLACPLLHFFMHGHHRGHSEDERGPNPDHAHVGHEMHSDKEKSP